MEKAPGVEVLPLADATLATAGAKAAACGRLLRLAVGSATSSSNGTGKGGGAPLFQAPDGVVLPFGSMEAAVAKAGKEAELVGLLRDLKSQLASWQASSPPSPSSSSSAAEGSGSGGGATPGPSPTSLAALDALCGSVQGLLRGLALPPAVLARVGAAFDPGCHLIARSSANVEDLAGLSGAGLYDSIPNIPAEDGEALRAAVCGVWASLFSRRAVLSRAAAGLPQVRACAGCVCGGPAPAPALLVFGCRAGARLPGCLVAGASMGWLLGAGRPRTATALWPCRHACQPAPP